MKAPDKTGPALSGFNKGNPFEVPKGYFEGFSDRLQDRIHAEDNVSSQKVIAINWKPYMAAAVMLLVALLSGTYFLSQTHSNRIDRRFHAEISLVVEQELYSIDETIILEVLSVDEPVNSSGNGVDARDAIDYLLNESLNEADLHDAL